ncbi:hypothetical protein DSM100688_1846 [Bifidobacterium ramosum]|uniref:Uncharacterized protein n=1 Tax=Bifidobacterium ramosum TaxID=1798158 RepID=A0A6L4WY94_9BIFI|nr:hypothetical protein DSM100688_1846 [Bifidobacterium ramosum]
MRYRDISASREMLCGNGLGVHMHDCTKGQLRKKLPSKEELSAKQTEGSRGNHPDSPQSASLDSSLRGEPRVTLQAHFCEAARRSRASLISFSATSAPVQ